MAPRVNETGSSDVNIVSIYYKCSVKGPITNRVWVLFTWTQDQRETEVSECQSRLCSDITASTNSTENLFRFYHPVQLIPSVTLEKAVMPIACTTEIDYNSSSSFSRITLLFSHSALNSKLESLLSYPLLQSPCTYISFYTRAVLITLVILAVHCNAVP